MSSFSKTTAASCMIRTHACKVALCAALLWLSVALFRVFESGKINGDNAAEKASWKSSVKIAGTMIILVMLNPLWAKDDKMDFLFHRL